MRVAKYTKKDREHQDIFVISDGKSWQNDNNFGNGKWQFEADSADGSAGTVRMLAKELPPPSLLNRFLTFHGW